MNFSLRSLRQLKTLHPELKLLMEQVIETSPIDFTLVQGYRSPHEQMELFKKGRRLVAGQWEIIDKSEVVTYIDGKEKMSKHNHNPSLAVDICVYVKDKPKLAYDANHLCHLAGYIFGVYQNLKERKLIEHTLRWGGNWDQDGEIITDQNFQDLPHFELQ